MRRINLLSGIFWCLIFTLACTSQNTSSPEVHFVYPGLNTFHDLNNELKIEIDISDDIMVSKYKFWIQSNSGFEYFLEEREVIKPSYKILYRFDLSNNIQGDFSIHLEVIDSDDNKTYKVMEIATI